MANTQLIILIAILFATAQAGLRAPTSAAANRVVPVSWLFEHFPEGALCTGVDLNVGCVPAGVSS